MSGYIPDVYNNPYNLKHLDRQLVSTGEGSFTLHDTLGDMSMNPETLLMQKEEAIADDFNEALEINKYYD